MPFEQELQRRTGNVRELHQQAYDLRVEAKAAEAKHRGLRITHARIERQLTGLWISANRAYERSMYAQFDSGRARANGGRYELLNMVIDDLSDTLMKLKDEIDLAEEVWNELRDRAEAAEILASRAAARLSEFGQNRKDLVAGLAGVPEPQRSVGAYEVRVNSRTDKIDVYYNHVGSEPLGEGHGHIVLSLDGTPRFHRKPEVPGVPKPGSWLKRRPRQMAMPLAA